jgi:predicted DsbA family dithiol-disulfide isomerase
VSYTSASCKLTKVYYGLERIYNCGWIVRRYGTLPPSSEKTVYVRIPIDLWSDFVCPWCFLVASSLEKLREEGRVALRWRAYELRPNGAARLPEVYRQRILDARPRLRAIAREQYGIEISEGPFGINSRRALIGAKYADKVGKGDAYHMAVFRAYWQQAQPIDDPKVLAGIAQEVGIDAAEFMDALDDSTLESEVIADEEEAGAHGLDGVPAIVFLQKYLVSGAQPYPVLRDIIEQIEAGVVG